MKVYNRIGTVYISPATIKQKYEKKCGYLQSPCLRKYSGKHSKIRKSQTHVISCFFQGMGRTLSDDYCPIIY